MRKLGFNRIRIGCLDWEFAQAGCILLFATRRMSMYVSVFG